MHVYGCIILYGCISRIRCASVFKPYRCSRGEDERSPFGRLNGKAFSWTMKTCSISVSVLGAEFCWRVNRRRRSTAGIVRRKASQSEDLCRLNNSSPRPGVLGRGESIAGAFAQFRIVCALVCALVRTRLCMRVYALACSLVSVSIF